MTNIEKSVKQVIEPIINNLGYRIYDVIYEKEGKDNYLRIFIDKDGIIDLNDCETVNNAINDILDEKDLIKNQYMLEVSSPGLERRIRDDKQLDENINKLIEVHTYGKINIDKIIEQEDSKKSAKQMINENESRKNLKQVNKNKSINNYIIDNKTIQGILIRFDDNSITVMVNKNEIKINKKDISNMKTVYNWED